MRRPIDHALSLASSTLVVASAADAAYAIPLAAMLKSMLTGLRPGRTVSVHVVDTGISERDRERLSQICFESGAALALHDPGPFGFDPLRLTGRMTKATYSRLVLPRLLPTDVKKVVWLDADVLVTGDLERLWETELSGHHLLAVQDPCVPFVSSRYGVRRWRELGLAQQAKYFNAGVMLIDLDRWRHDEIGERAGNYVRDYEAGVTFWDQEGLNAVLSGRWGELDVRWNNCPGFTMRSKNMRSKTVRSKTVRAKPESVRLDSSIPDPSIIHFAGTLKPWLLPAPKSGPRALFYKKLDETPWAGWRPRRTPASVARGWYEASRLRDVLYPAEHWWMLTLGRRVARVVRRRAAT